MYSVYSFLISLPTHCRQMGAWTITDFLRSSLDAAATKIIQNHDIDLTERCR